MLPRNLDELEVAHLNGESAVSELERQMLAEIHLRDAESHPSTDVPEIVRDGATFVLDDPAELEPRWGSGSEVLWARGETLIVAGPPGVGKTTLAGQILAALIGCERDALGFDVRPATRVLYLAMDRPRQVRRALRRRFSEQDRPLLAAHLVVRAGPLPADLAREPGQLLALARQHGCDVVIVDSLKDAAVKLTDDETGGNINRALQLCNAADVDVCVLHHQRKASAGETKPTSLAAVYGSTWITAGAGSVILLWGEPGSEIIELSHLKQPADPVGPFTIEHDHHLGTSKIARGFDALAFLRNRGDAGATVSDAAQAEHGSPQKTGSASWKRTERRLRALVRDGHATHQKQAAVGGEARYFAVDTPRGHALYEPDVDET